MSSMYRVGYISNNVVVHKPMVLSGVMMTCVKAILKSKGVDIYDLNFMDTSDSDYNVFMYKVKEDDLCEYLSPMPFTYEELLIKELDEDDFRESDHKYNTNKIVNGYAYYFKTEMIVNTPKIENKIFTVKELDKILSNYSGYKNNKRDEFIDCINRNYNDIATMSNKGKLYVWKYY